MKRCKVIRPKSRFFFDMLPCSSAEDVTMKILNILVEGENVQSHMGCPLEPTGQSSLNFRAWECSKHNL